jgi:hypothetical protein
MNDRIRETHQLVELRFGRQFGENQKSSLEDMMKFASEIVENYSESKRMLDVVFQELRALEELIMPKKMALDGFVDSQAAESQAKTKSLVPPDDQFESGSDVGFDRRSAEASTKRRYSIRSEPGDIKEGRRQKLKRISKSASQIAVREKLKKDRSTIKKSRSKGNKFCMN